MYYIIYSEIPPMDPVQRFVLIIIVIFVYSLAIGCNWSRRNRGGYFLHHQHHQPIPSVFLNIPMIFKYPICICVCAWFKISIDFLYNYLVAFSMLEITSEYGSFSWVVFVDMDFPWHRQTNSYSEVYSSCSNDFQNVSVHVSEAACWL